MKTHDSYLASLSRALRKQRSIEHYGHIPGKRLPAISSISPRLLTHGHIVATKTALPSGKKM